MKHLYTNPSNTLYNFLSSFTLLFFWKTGTLTLALKCDIYGRTDTSLQLETWKVENEQVPSLFSLKKKIITNNDLIQDEKNIYPDWTIAAVQIAGGSMNNNEWMFITYCFTNKQDWKT